MNIIGKYNTAKVFTEDIEESAIEQIKTLCDQPFCEGIKIRIMPDVHSGAGCTIGTTMTILDKVVPNMVGVDIGCGMYASKISEAMQEDDLSTLDAIIRKKIPSGFSIHPRALRYTGYDIDLSELRCVSKYGMPQSVIDRAYRSIGTLGGGNHFIEVDKTEDGVYWLVIHSGSRNLGLNVANLYQNIGLEQFNSYPKSINAYVGIHMKELPKEERTEEAAQKFRQEYMEQKTGEGATITAPPKQLAYLQDGFYDKDGTLFSDYIHDMKIVTAFASINRKVMMDIICLNMGWNPAVRFETIHNYIDTDRMILRKGSVSAEEGQLMLISLNMRDGALICEGKGNEDWNYSAPHGAGRIMSRTAAIKNCDMEEYKTSMQGIFTTSVNKDTLDECPMAYKPADSIIKAIGETAEIKEHIMPVYNFKAAEKKIGKNKY